jgi:AAA+ ATPase superfamily predicted ATPase
MNPFYITGIIPSAYFCDRETETDWLVRTVTNQANVLLTSPRRMGKTQLIRHFYERPEIKGHYHTFYVDIYPTTSLHEFVLFLSKEIYSVLVPKGKATLNRFLSVLRSLTGSFTYDPVSGIPSFDVKLGDIQAPELTLGEIFDYLEKADLPCIFAIDEFQQIDRYPEKNVEALLRSHVQTMNNCRFIFAGSNRHILENMFHSAAKPFYNSTEQLYLDRIAREKYVAFICDKFREAGREILSGAAQLAYDIFEGHTYYVHNLLHHVFATVAPEKTVDENDILFVLDTLLEEKAHAFAGQLSQLNYGQKETLVAIAKAGKATGVTSVAFIKKNALKSPSSVQYAITTLLDSQILTYEQEGRGKTYSLEDRFLELWVRRVY